MTKRLPLWRSPVRKATLLLIAALLAVSCNRGSVVALAPKKPATSPSVVRIYTSMPPGAEVMGLVEGRAVGGWTHQQHAEGAMASLRENAASIGANGVVIQSAGQETSGALVVPNGYSAMVLPMSEPVLRGTAVYVRP